MLLARRGAGVLQCVPERRQSESAKVQLATVRVAQRTIGAAIAESWGMLVVLQPRFGRPQVHICWVGKRLATHIAAGAASVHDALCMKGRARGLWCL